MKCSFRLCYLALVLMIPYIVSSFSVLHAPIANPLSASPSSSMFRATAAAPTRLHLTPDPVSRAAKVDTVGLSSSSLKKKNLRTFARYLEVECWKSPNLRSLESVLTSATRACAQISKIVQRAQTDDIYGAAVDKATGLALEANVQGEVQQKLDVVCNEIMKKAFCGCSDDVAAVATEEEEKPLMCSDVSVVYLPFSLCQSVPHSNSNTPSPHPPTSNPGYPLPSHQRGRIRGRFRPS